MPTDGEKIVLGSGTLYCMEFTGALPENTAIEVDANRLGYIQGGASLEYKPTFYEAKDDMGKVVKIVITEEEATLKSGIMTWCGNTLKKLCSTARVTESGGIRTVKIGGVSNDDGKKYVIHFVHEDPVDGDIRVTIVGQNQAGFTLAFAKNKETVIDAQFKAQPHDTEGTLIKYTEEIGVLGNLSVTSVEGSTTGKTAITVTPALTAGNSYMYKTAASVTLPAYGDVCDVAAGYTAWTSGTEVTATTGNEILIIEVDSEFKAVNAGKATVTSMA